MLLGALLGPSLATAGSTRGTPEPPPAVTIQVDETVTGASGSAPATSRAIGWSIVIDPAVEPVAGTLTTSDGGATVVVPVPGAGETVDLSLTADGAIDGTSTDVTCTVDGTAAAAAVDSTAGSLRVGLTVPVGATVACTLSTRPSDGRPTAVTSEPGDRANVGVVKWIDGVPAAWPITATILGDTAATFADGTTTAQVTTDATGEPVVLDLRSVPADGVQVRLSEPLRSDASFRDVVCESSGAPYPHATQIERGVDLVVFPQATAAPAPTWGDGRPYPVCWFENVPATEIVMTSRLDGSTAAAGFEVAVLPVLGQVGEGGIPDADGIFATSSAAPTVVELSGFESEGATDVFIGQVALAGTTIYGVECVTSGVDGGADTVVDGPLESRSVGGRTIVGVTLRVNAHDGVSCSVDNASADLEATKQASTTDVGPGTVFTYTIVARNSGLAPLFDVTLDDPVPATLTLLDVTSDEASTTCRSSGNQVDCSYGDLLPGAVRTVRLTVSVRADVANASNITNVATVSGEVPLWVPGLSVSDPLRTEGVVRPPVFAAALHAVASNVVHALAPETTTTLAPATTAAPAPSVVPTTVEVAQQSPIPTVATGGASLPTTGADLSLLHLAAWFAVAGVVLVAVRRLRPAGGR